MPSATNWFPSPLQFFSSASPSPSTTLLLTGQTLLVTSALAFIVFMFGRRRQQQIAASDGQDADAGNMQEAIELEDSPGVYKSGLLRDRPEQVLERYFPEVATLWDSFKRGMKLSAKNACLGWRPTTNGGDYKFLTYEEVAERSQWLGTSLISELGLHPSNGTFVALYARNCPEWIIMTLACIRHSIVIVPLYDTLGPDAATYILAHTGASLVLIDELRRLENVFSMKQNTPELRHVVLVEKPEAAKLAEINQRAEAIGIEVHLWDELLAKGQQRAETEQQPDREPTSEDTYMLCYTSGTTGTPKGVLLSHRNMVANLTAVCMLFRTFLPDLMTSQDHSLISYLPLSHVFEQVCHWSAICLGYRIGYLSGTIANLSADMQALQPTLFPVVPRLLNRLNDSIKAEVARASPIKRWLFNFAKSQKASLLHKGIVTNKTIWDKLVFAKAHQQLGGKVQLIFTGSAPIAAEVLEDLRLVFGVQILEGYGQTECTAMATCTWPGEVKGGHCGGPSTCTLLKLADVPELNYFAADRKGEVMIRGPSVTSGYYRDPEKTAELFDEDGFLHTGDIGQLLPNNTLRIIDRKKHIFKLAQGEYVAPEKIENVYVQCRFVQQIYVDGDSLERHLVAIVVPQEKTVRQLYTELVGDGETKPLAEICEEKRVVTAMLAEMHKFGKGKGLNSIEQVKAIHMEAESFSVDNGLLTPTLKAKRPQLRAKYKEVMARLYRESAANGAEK